MRIKPMMEISNFMSQLADSWYLDRARPVRVHEGLAESQVFKIFFADFVRGLVQGHIKVSRFDTTNCSLLRNQEKVKALIISIFDKLGINNSAWRRVYNHTFFSAEHSLVDSFIDDNQSDLGRTHLVVLSFESLLNLNDLFFDTVLPLLFTKTISENYDLIRHRSTVSLEVIECLS